MKKSSPPRPSRPRLLKNCRRLSPTRSRPVSRNQQTLDHPALTTSFQDYTVTEGLLLLILLAAFAAACIRILKGGFSWLRW